MATNIGNIETYNPNQFSDFFTNCGQYNGSYYTNYWTADISSTFKISFYPYHKQTACLSHSNPFRNKGIIKINWKYESNISSPGSAFTITFTVGIGNTKTSFKSNSKYYYTYNYQPYFSNNYSTSGTLSVDLSDLNEDLYVVVKIERGSGDSYNSTSNCTLTITSVLFE